MNLKKLEYLEIETDSSKRRKNRIIDNLKKLVINEVKTYCKLLGNGHQDFCYQDTLNKILFVELNEDLSNISLVF